MLGQPTNNGKSFKYSGGRAAGVGEEGSRPSLHNGKYPSEIGMPKLMIDISGGGLGMGNSKAMESFTTFKTLLLTKYLDSPDLYQIIKTGRPVDVEARMMDQFLYEQKIARGYSEELEKTRTIAESLSGR
jgi:hypothetical protein